jgi:hypothetical protein
MPTTRIESVRAVRFPFSPRSVPADELSTEGNVMLLEHEWDAAQILLVFQRLVDEQSFGIAAWTVIDAIARPAVPRSAKEDLVEDVIELMEEFEQADGTSYMCASARYLSAAFQRETLTHIVRLDSILVGQRAIFQGGQCAPNEGGVLERTDADFNLDVDFLELAMKLWRDDDGKQIVPHLR